MARPRKVAPEDSLLPRAGDARPKSGTYLARRAKATLRADESRRLSVDETRDGMRFTEEQLRVLDAIAAGLPVRAAREAIAALRLKADFLLARPPAHVDHRLGIQVISPYMDDPAPTALAGAVVTAALPEGQAPAADDAPPFEDEEDA